MCGGQQVTPNHFNPTISYNPLFPTFQSPSTSRTFHSSYRASLPQRAIPHKSIVANCALWVVWRRCFLVFLELGFRMATAAACGSMVSRGVQVNWASSSLVSGDGGARELYIPVRRRSVAIAAFRGQPRMMGNKNEGKGIFAPLVVLARNILGKKEFNQLRGKGIALHSQVIGEFCKSIGADAKQRQGLIRLAKKNGEKLGFLA